MTVQEKPYPVVSLVVDVFGEWLKHRRELKEMREMDAASFDRIAGELRMSSTDLEALVRRGPHAADELPKMLAALGVNQQDLARTEPLVLRDMSVFARCATTSANATAISPPAPPLRIMKSIAAMPIRSTASVRK
jgi:transposase